MKTIIVNHVCPCNEAAHILFMTMIHSTNDDTKQKCNYHYCHKYCQTNGTILWIGKAYNLCLVFCPAFPCIFSVFGTNRRPALFHDHFSVPQKTADREVHSKHSQKAQDCYSINHPHSFSPFLSIYIKHAF